MLMRFLKELFNLRIILNCLVFAIPVSMLILLRIDYTEQIPLLCQESLEVFLSCILLTFLVVRGMLLILYFLSGK